MEGFGHEMAIDKRVVFTVTDEVADHEPPLLLAGPSPSPFITSIFGGLYPSHNNSIAFAFS
ncbi:hypothetical protein L484_027828 [Morus notabilis]|uniref:Uncharacterized protein n=1 Tax=Morus notabilis TaxID=981085 RepID=W9RCZ1_9ROSA|nr:hypothetical protein L484_027828 [Morus notabilis]